MKIERREKNAMEKKAPVIYLKPTNAKGRTYVYVVSKSKTKVVYLKALGHFDNAYKLLCKWQDEDSFPEELLNNGLTYDDLANWIYLLEIGLTEEGQPVQWVLNHLREKNTPVN